ncbi:MAG: AtpZ/AtpI family protein [Dehalococcoidales bacterium]|nr:AtpZ/AtpI family protein [Dehalococcoidales bacterium]
MKKWAALRLTGLGFFIGGCIAGGALAGWYLGAQKPFFMILGIIAGLLVAGYGTYRMLLPLIQNSKKENS